jgi:sulfur relay protein TusB/DsrH
MLHLIFTAPLDIAVLDRMTEGDSAVFMDDAALSLLKHGRFKQTLTAKLKANRLFVIAEDLTARGILSDELTPGLELIDYAALVKLTVENKQILTWR